MPFALAARLLDLEERLCRLLAAHHRDARRRPRHDQARVVGLAAHRVVARAERVARDDGELRDDRVGDGVDHLRAVLDDAAVLGARADHEAGHVLEEHQRDALLVAVHDEPRGLVGRVGVDHPARLHLVGVRLLARLRLDDLPLVGDDAHAPPVDAGVAAEERLAVASFVLRPRVGVHDAREEVACVVGLVARLGHEAVEFVGVERRGLPLDAVEASPVAGTEAADEVADRHAQLKRVYAALDRRPAREQLAVSLYYIEALTLDEVGEILGVSASRVSQLLRRARAEVRKIIEVQDEQIAA